MRTSGSFILNRLFLIISYAGKNPLTIQLRHCQISRIERQQKLRHGRVGMRMSVSFILNRLFLIISYAGKNPMTIHLRHC